MILLWDETCYVHLVLVWILIEPTWVRKVSREYQREVVVLHYYLGYPVREIAGLLSVSEGNVKNALLRARASLATALRVEEEVPND